MKFNESLNRLINENSFYKATELIKEYKEKNPNHKVISLGIGDVSFPINKTVAEAMSDAAFKESSDFFVGYGNYYGLLELREAIKENEYPSFSTDEIYVSDGTKSDCLNILEMIDGDALIAIPSPTYPIYENGCITLNKKYEKIPCDENFIPLVPNKHFDVIFLCSPNNPTGINYSKEDLQSWVDYANKENALIIYDNVYFKFIRSGLKSIYECDGARKCAIELRSFSKHASFTGVRCSYYVVPNELHENINKLWKLRTINRFNGASYIAQVGALKTFEPNIKKELEINVEAYLENARLLKNAFEKHGYKVIGGIDSPYLWIENKNKLSSWETFNRFLTELEIVVVPGIIFGEEGDNYFRVSALGKKNDVLEAIKRIEHYEKD